jgi:hypothetical protein
MVQLIVAPHPKTSAPATNKELLPGTDDDEEEEVADVPPVRAPLPLASQSRKGTARRYLPLFAPSRSRRRCADSCRSQHNRTCPSCLLR